MNTLTEARKAELLNLVKGWKKRRMGAEIGRGFAPNGQKTCTTTLWLYRLSVRGISKYPEVELTQEEFNMLLEEGIKEHILSFDTPAGKGLLATYKEFYGVE